MADISVGNPNLPFVPGPHNFTVHVGTIDIDKPLPKTVAVVFDIETGAAGDKPVVLGGSNQWTIAIKAEGMVKLAPVWDTAGGPVLVLTVGASADGKFSGQFRYAALTATASLEAAADCAFTYSRPFVPALPLKDVLPAFFGRVQVPSAIGRPLDPGEVIKFEYGGYLSIAGGVSAGYEIKGAPKMTVGQLLLSEHYDLTVIGKVGFTGMVGGFFGVEIRTGDDRDGDLLPAGWARVIVKKTRASEFTFAADGSVGLVTSPQGLPEKPNDFLGALLGVNTKNWLNLLNEVQDLTTFEGLQSKVDGLAMDYLVELAEKSTNAPDFLPSVLAKAKRIADAYNNIDETVLSAFDRYFDKITNPALGKEIGDAIVTVAHLKSWGELKGDVDPTVWSLVNELTGGDPLGWILEKGVNAIQKKAQDLLDLGGAAVHAEVRAAIALAKARFGLNPLFAELAKIGTVEDLKAEGGTALGAFVQRLFGNEIQKLETSKLGDLLTRIHKGLDAATRFEGNVYAKIKDALNQNLSLKLHAEYSRASDTEALIDININASTPTGLALLQKAGRGDFQSALDAYRPDLVRLNSGRLTHNLITQSALNINVEGWHSGWHFLGLEKLLLNTEQQIVTDASGSLTVYTTMDLKTEKDRKTTQEETFTNLLLRFFGESRGILERDDDNVEYLIDAITHLSARYELGFRDAKTTEKELAYYLSFARNFGLASPQVSTVKALLPQVAVDNFGPVSVTYDVAYARDGLKELFGKPLSESVIRSIMRRVVLANYLPKGGQIADAGWAYWTPAVRSLWEQTRPAFAKQDNRRFEVARSPFQAIPSPTSVVLGFQAQNDLDVLYRIEDGFTNGLLKIETLVSTGTKMSPHEFESALGDIGAALQDLSTFGESPNTTFAVLDALLASVGGAQRASSMTLRSQVAGQSVTKIFLT